MTDFGTDISASPDLDGFLRPQSGTRVVAEAIARRLTTPRGGLFYAPDYGFDIRELLNEGLTPAAIFAAQSAIEGECLKDQRVDAASATVEAPGVDRLRITVRLTTADGPFTMVLGVDAVTVALLRVAQGNS